MEGLTATGLLIQIDLDLDRDKIIDAGITTIDGNSSGDTGLLSLNGSHPTYQASSGAIIIGDHQFTVSAWDPAGRFTRSTLPFRVVDEKAPAPLAINGTSENLMPTAPGTDADGDGDIDTGTITIWATDFIASPITDCSGPITYSINRIGEPAIQSQSSIVFTCEDVGSVDIQVWAWDSAGNAGFAESFILVQDPLDLCSASPE